MHNRWFFETLEEITFTKCKDDPLFVSVVTCAFVSLDIQLCLHESTSYLQLYYGYHVSPKAIILAKLRTRSFTRFQMKIAKCAIVPRPEGGGNHRPNAGHLGEAKSVSDLMSSYRRVRDRNLQQENQVMAFSEDDHNHKVVLDVHDFKSGDVKVRVEDNQVVVEGRVEKEEGDYKSLKSFCRCFNFPGKVDMEAVTSAMSSDGVLTVTAPKIPQAA
nr:protein lethal(2)essential for life-like [Penaeus vannamei]